MNKIYIYLRVSTDSQDLEGNKKEINKFIVDKNFKGEHIEIKEIVTGTRHWRKRKLNNIIVQATKNDIIIMSELSRISRKMLECMEFIAEIAKKEIRLYFTLTPFKVDNSIESKVLIFAYSLSAEISRNLCSVRTKNALKKAKANGVKLGRRTGSKNKHNKLDPFKEEIKLMLNYGSTKKFIAKKLNVDQHTLYKYIKKNNLKKI